MYWNFHCRDYKSHPISNEEFKDYYEKGKPIFTKDGITYMEEHLKKVLGPWLIESPKKHATVPLIDPGPNAIVYELRTYDYTSSNKKVIRTKQKYTPDRKDPS